MYLLNIDFIDTIDVNFCQCTFDWVLSEAEVADNVSCISFDIQAEPLGFLPQYYRG